MAFRGSYSRNSMLYREQKPLPSIRVAGLDSLTLITHNDEDSFLVVRLYSHLTAKDALPNSMIKAKSHYGKVWSHNMDDIVTCGEHRAVTTARAELIGALARTTGRSLSSTNFHVGLFEDSPERSDLIRRGLVNLHNVPPGRDAFECLREGGTIYLLGSTPRGVLPSR